MKTKMIVSLVLLGMSFTLFAKDDCSKIKEEKDKFSDRVTYSSPLMGLVSLTKVKENGASHLFMSLCAFGKTASINEKGVIILLKNGEKITKSDTPIKTTSSYNGYMYLATIELNAEDILKLQASQMTDIRLYIYDGVINYGPKIQNMINCLEAK